MGRAVTSLSSALRLEPLASRSARLLSCRSMSRGYTTSPTQNPHDASLSSILASHLQQGNLQSMDARQPEYPQSDQASAVQYTPGQDYKSSTFSSSATPNSEYALPPQSARSSSGAFPDYVRSTYPDSAAGRYQAPAHSGNAMAHTSNPSIAQASPTYPPTQHYSPYPPQHEMPQYPGQPMTQNRPEWAGYYQQPPMGYSHSPATTGGAAPNMVAHVPRPPPAGGHPLSTVYSFVPIPGAQQHKRPRRRYEEIERMYKCGWNGCEKAYGTLNHLNAHVTMQSHGTKRTPEEFKEIRKEWKARKKEEENARKAEEERQRQAAAQASQVDGQAGDAHQVPGQGYQQNGARPSLPPIGYQSADGHAQGQYAQPQGGMVYPQGNGQMGNYANYPNSPYAQQGQVYQQ